MLSMAQVTGNPWVLGQLQDSNLKHSREDEDPLTLFRQHERNQSPNEVFYTGNTPARLTRRGFGGKLGVG